MRTGLMQQNDVLFIVETSALSLLLLQYWDWKEKIKIPGSTKRTFNVPSFKCCIQSFTANIGKHASQLVEFGLGGYPESSTNTIGSTSQAIDPFPYHGCSCGRTIYSIISSSSCGGLG